MLQGRERGFDTVLSEVEASHHEQSIRAKACDL